MKMVFKILIIMVTSMGITFADDLNKANELNEKGVIYEEMGEYKQAFKYYKKALDIRERVLGKEHPLTAQSYSNMGQVYHNTGNYKKSLTYHKKALDIKEKILGQEHLDTAVSCNNIGSLYESMGKLNTALDYYKKSIFIEEKILGNENLDIAISYNNIGSLYTKLGDYPKALDYLQKSLTIRKDILGEEHSKTATAYNNLALLYNTMGEYEEALSFYEKALIINQKKLGKNHPNTAKYYANIGSVYETKGEYSKALNYYEKSLAITIKILGKEHPSTAVSYSNIAMLYQKMDNYSKALNLYKKALSIFIKKLGKEHTYTATGYSNLASLYLIMDDYPKAIKHYTKSLAIDIKVLGQEHIYTAKNYNNLGAVYHKLGNYSAALKHLKKALSIREKVLGEEHTDVAESLNNICQIYSMMKEPSTALTYCKKSLLINKKVLGEKHSNTAINYNNIGGIYSGMDKHQKALEYYTKALSIRKKVLGIEHSDIAQSYHNVAGIYKDMKNYIKALSYYEKSLIISKKILGNEHSTIANTYNNISSLYETKKDYAKAYNYAKKSFDIFVKNQDKNFQALTNKEKNIYLKSNKHIVSLLFRVANILKEKNQTLNQEMLNAWLNYKGGIFDSENSISTLYTNTKDKSLREKIEDLTALKRGLAKLYQSIPKPKEREAWKTKIEEIENKIATLTSEITQKASNFKEQQGLNHISYKDIAKHLKENELYIDYAKAGEYYYIFTIDSREKITFTQIDQQSSALIDSEVKAFREDVKQKNPNLKYSKEKLSKLYELLIANPLQERIESKKSLIISPDGALRLLPFEALYDATTEHYLLESKKIRYIPSGKELVRLYKYSQDKQSNRDSVVFANPNFDSTIKSDKREHTSITPNTNRSGIIKALFTMRFSPLDGTKEEAKNIKAILNDKIVEYLQDEANEDNLIDIQQPKILHIATHGFFINDNSIPNPMLKSGIALTGANSSAIKGESNGIVTALKLSGLKLKGTDLVVLSACETGVVDIDNTDGVSGLGKAFIQAGAKNMVMSLWSVGDQATKDLMTSFYKEIVQNNNNYADALQKAKMEMVKQDMHPFYWAGFVISGL
jgi:CHAT domain-containing protein/Tfp pilus assembly protein PilF